MIEKLLFSIILGFLIGLEREKHGKSVGIKTISLITLGSTLFAIMSISLVECDKSRIIAQVVSGVGFIGAGVVFKNNTTISGLTTAATIWCASAIGCLCGVSMYKEALAATTCIMLINLTFNYFKDGRKSKT